MGLYRGPTTSEYHCQDFMSLNLCVYYFIIIETALFWVQNFPNATLEVTIRNGGMARSPMIYNFWRDMCRLSTIHYVWFFFKNTSSWARTLLRTFCFRKGTLHLLGSTNILIMSATLLFLRCLQPSNKCLLLKVRTTKCICLIQVTLSIPSPSKDISSVHFVFPVAFR